MEHMQKTIRELIFQLDETIKNLPPGVFSAPSKSLAGASIGSHVHHIIEMYQSLLNGYDSGVVKYERRIIDKDTEILPVLATNRLELLMMELYKNNKDLVLVTGFDERSSGHKMDTNYYRELLYCFEHTIHHMALIRIAIIELTNMKLPGNFGVSLSTSLNH